MVYELTYIMKDKVLAGQEGSWMNAPKERGRSRLTKGDCGLYLANMGDIAIADNS